MSSSVGTIPGGRQRAASDGDVIDDDDDEALAGLRLLSYQQQLSPSHRKVVGQSLIVSSSTGNNPHQQHYHSSNNHSNNSDYYNKAGTIGPGYTSSSYYSDYHPKGYTHSNNTNNTNSTNGTTTKHGDIPSSVSSTNSNNTKKKHRKTSFKNVKNFVSRVVMRQSTLPSSSSNNNTTTTSGQQLSKAGDSRGSGKRLLNTGATSGRQQQVAPSTTMGTMKTVNSHNTPSDGDRCTVGVNSAITSNSSSLLSTTCKSLSSVTTSMNVMSIGGGSNSSNNTTTIVPVTVSVAGGSLKDRDFYSNHYDSSTSRPLVTKNNINGVGRINNNSSCVSNNNNHNNNCSGRHLAVWGNRTPGTTGLHNHGNTCFMNAVLQCLNNAGFLAGYFVTGRYKDALQRNNNTTTKNNCKTLGTTKGEVTHQLGTLLRSLWSGNYNADISSEFKTVVGKYNPQYRGSDQHDAQEFLLWLLDRVHEDLNLVTKRTRPAMPPPLSRQDGLLSEDEAAIEMNSCNTSFIYQLFRGLYRSSLTCLKCERQSNTYDPYLCLSLPLPQIPDRAIYIIIFYHESRDKGIKIGVLLKNTDTIKDLRCCLANFPSISKSQFILCQIEPDGFCNTFTDSQSISDISEAENVYLFELPTPVLQASTAISSSHSQPGGGPSYQMSLIHILLIHVEHKNGSAPTAEKCVHFCCPQMLSVPRDISYSELQRKILLSMGSSLKDDVSAQTLSKQNVLFKLQVIDGIESKDYLPHDVEMPLYMPVVDRALSACNSNPELAHIKIIVEWETRIREMIVNNKEKIIEEQASVMKVQNAHQKMGNTSLEECFHLYTQEEELSGDTWRCPHCYKDQHGATKNLRLWSLPGILVVHLKRFKQVKMQRNKLNILVDFPMWGLDLGQHLVTSNGQQYSRPSNGHQTGSFDYGISEPEDGHRDVYDLFSVCNHYGNMTGGHYTAFCKNPIDGSWYQYDDSRVKPISKNDVVTKAAYLLFYQRRSLSNRQMNEVQRGKHWIYPLHGISLGATAETEEEDNNYEEDEDNNDEEEEEEEEEEAPLPPVRTTSRSSYRSSTPPPPRWRQQSLPPLLSSGRSLRYNHHPPPPPPIYMAPVAVLEPRGTISTHIRAPPSSYYRPSDSNGSRSMMYAAEEENEEEDEPKSLAKAFNVWHRNVSSTSGQQPQSSASILAIKKFATIARTESPSHLDPFGPNDQAFMARSRTYHDIESHSQAPSSRTASSPQQPAPPKTNGRIVPTGSHSSNNHLQHSYSADSHLVSTYRGDYRHGHHSRRAAYKLGASQGQASRSLNETERYQHPYFLTKYKPQKTAFHQERLGTPCLKESSV